VVSEPEREADAGTVIRTIVGVVVRTVVGAVIGIRCVVRGVVTAIVAPIMPPRMAIPAISIVYQLDTIPTTLPERQSTRLRGSR